MRLQHVSFGLVQPGQDEKVLFWHDAGQSGDHSLFEYENALRRALVALPWSRCPIEQRTGNPSDRNEGEGRIRHEYPSVCLKVVTGSAIDMVRDVALVVVTGARRAGRL